MVPTGICALLIWNTPILMLHKTGPPNLITCSPVADHTKTHCCLISEDFNTTSGKNICSMLRSVPMVHRGLQRINDGGTSLQCLQDGLHQGKILCKTFRG